MFDHCCKFCLSKMCIEKANHSCRITCECSESARRRRIALHKSYQQKQQQQQHFRFTPLHFPRWLSDNRWRVSGTTIRLLSMIYCILLLYNIQYNFIAKCQYTGCTRNVLWCQVHSSHIHSNHKTLEYNNSK